MREIDELILGESLTVRRLRALITRAAPSSLPVLIEGPTGSGKELVAEALHGASGRNGAYVPFNVCALADGMLEDALFGHVRGAYTGALSDREGLLREAHHGTLFLDEISGLSIASQTKLLRAIELGTFRPVGARSDCRSQFRVIAASNVSVTALVTAGVFRADLAYRLAGLTIHVPALRDRSEDIPLLANHFLRCVEPVGKYRLTQSATTALLSHAWPGNVRELRHTIERAALLSTSHVISRETVAAALWPSGAVLPTQRAFSERRLLAELDAAAWNVDTVAEAMGVHRATLYRRIKRMGAVMGGRPRKSHIERRRDSSQELPERPGSTRRGDTRD